MGGPKLKLGNCVLPLEKLRDALKENTDAHPETRLKAIQMAAPGHFICQEAAHFLRRTSFAVQLRHYAPPMPAPTGGSVASDVSCRVRPAASQNRQLSKTID